MSRQSLMRARLHTGLTATLGRIQDIAYRRVGIWGSSAESIRAPADEAINDVTETDKGYEVEAELPGIEEKNMEVKVTDGVLTIKGEKQDEKEEKRRTII